MTLQSNFRNFIYNNLTVKQTFIYSNWQIKRSIALFLHTRTHSDCKKVNSWERENIAEIIGLHGLKRMSSWWPWYSRQRAATEQRPSPCPKTLAFLIYEGSTSLNNSYAQLTQWSLKHGLPFTASQKLINEHNTLSERFASPSQHYFMAQELNLGLHMNQQMTQISLKKETGFSSNKFFNDRSTSRS